MGDGIVKKALAAAVLALPFLVVSLVIGAPAARADQIAVARSAINAADAGRWSEAYDTASREPLIKKLITWMDIARPASPVAFDDIAKFVAVNPDWPLPQTMRMRAEDSLLPGADPAKVVAFFQQYPPLMPNGATAYAEALRARGDEAGAVATLRKFFADGKMTSPQVRDFIARHGPSLRADDYWLRADRLVWDGDIEGAQPLVPWMNGEPQAQIQARIALTQDAGNADAAFTRLSEDSQMQPGVAFERAKWLRRHDRDLDAIAILDATAPTVPRPEKWWNERNLLARRALDRGAVDDAYRIAAEHRQIDGLSYNDAEWLAGFIALRGKDDPNRAERHFLDMSKKVQTPISVARANYWLGRAREKRGDEPGARAAYEIAARHIHTFYGQLAHAKVHPGKPLVLPPQPSPSPSELVAFGRHENVEVARLLARLDEDRRADIFVRRIVELADKPVDALLALRLAKETNDTPVVVQLAKKLAQNGVAVLSDGYPTVPLPNAHPEPALVNAIIRQESLFNPGAVSSAGAQGLMQLMPATASAMAKMIKVKHKVAQLLQPAHNVQLGSVYLEQLVDRFGGSYVMAVAGYNAGPGRPAAWRRGELDPKANLERAIDFVERIPFAETRNYVQRVLENVSIYRCKLAGGSAPLRIEQDLTR
ncbi:MAG: putative lytic transglycosylase [Rhodospirillales bacterium]|nr:putative lytic transglycosylase [Rhodospirillales bacterium]